MAAENDNKYAETITRETALALAKQALELINDECFFVSDVAEKCGIYRTKFNYILTKFNDDSEVKDALERMYNKCESILVKHSAKGKVVNPIFGIFILKSYHNLIEVNKTQHELEVSDLATLYKKAMSSNEKSQS
jgi:hypothetical protein